MAWNAPGKTPEHLYTAGGLLSFSSSEQTLETRAKTKSNHWLRLETAEPDNQTTALAILGSGWKRFITSR